MEGKGFKFLHIITEFLRSPFYCVGSGIGNRISVQHRNRDPLRAPRISTNHNRSKNNSCCAIDCCSASDASTSPRAASECGHQINCEPPASTYCFAVLRLPFELRITPWSCSRRSGSKCPHSVSRPASRRNFSANWAVAIREEVLTALTRAS